MPAPACPRSADRATTSILRDPPGQPGGFFAVQRQAAAVFVRACGTATENFRNILGKNARARIFDSRNFHSTAMVVPHNLGHLNAWGVRKGKIAAASRGGFSMLLHDGPSTAPQTRNLIHSARLPHCPQCGDFLLAPLLSEH